MGPRAWWFGPPPVIRHAQVSPHKRGLARQLRQEGTDSERAAWELLRNRRTLGLKFRRQQPVRGYIVDFYCAALRLALEIDGSIHGSSLERFAYDLERDERLREHEIAVLHIRPQDVLKLPEILAWWLREHPLSREGEGAGGEVIRDRKRASDAARCAGNKGCTPC